MKKADGYNSKIIDDALKGISTKEANKVEKDMLLAVKIYDAMKAKGWNKTDFANAVKKNNSVITKWLSGTHTFTTDTLYEIEDVLNISLIQVEATKMENEFSTQLSLPVDMSLPSFLYRENEKEKVNYSKYTQMIISEINKKNSNCSYTCKS